jgi:hypothetical protein
MSLTKDKKDSEFLVEDKDSGEVCIQDDDGVQKAHHWMLESPNGRMSLGTCKFCGTGQRFSNVPDFHYTGSRANFRNKSRAKK